MHRACRAAGRTAAELEASTVASTGRVFAQAQTPFAGLDRTFSGRPGPAEGVN